MTDGDDRYDLGVLFVHGIGQQARGQTLTAWADPVIRWLEVWLRRESVEVGAAELGPLPEDPAAPARVELRVVSSGRADDAPTARRWLLTEAWWAEAFTLPRFRELAVWGFAVLPWTVVAHFAARLQQAWHGPRAPRQAPARGRLRTLAGVPARIARVSWQSLGLFLAVALFPLLAVGVLAVVILGAVPIPWVRQLAVALQRLLSTSVGDSFVLVSSPTRGQAIVTRVQRDLLWLTDRCQRVAVVAHSQGAAIAHRALRRVPPGERKLAAFVTVGSGQTKLVDLENLRDTDAAREVWLAPAGLLVLTTSIWLAVGNLRSGGREPADGWWFGPLWLAFMGLLFLLLGIGAAWPRRQPDADEVEVDAERGWLDLYASHDPVANGALFHLSSMPGTQLPLTSRPVYNLASPLRDHTSYWRNRDEFVSTIAATLADAAGQSVDKPHSWDASTRRVAAARRRWRVGWLQGLRVLAVATAAVLLVAHARRWGAIGRRAVDLATSRADLLPLVEPSSGASVPSQARQGIGMLAIALATLAGYLLLAGIWRWWDARESAWTLGRNSARHWTTEFVALLTGVAALLAMAWLLSAGASFTPTTELIGLPFLFIGPFFVYAMFLPGLRLLLRLLERLGYADGVDRERAVVPALLPGAAAGLIVLLLDPSEISLGATIALIAGLFGLPLLAALLPPLLAASPAMRGLGWRLRAWAHAEPAPLAHARLLGPGDGDKVLIAYGNQLAEALQAPAPEDPEAAAQLGDVREVALVVARTLQQRGRGEHARRLLRAAAPTSADAAIALLELEPASAPAREALRRHRATGRWRERRRVRASLEAAAVATGGPR